MSGATARKRVLSGIQPNGRLHIGNYVGALSVWVAQQRETENFFCIADLHALTVPEAMQGPELRRQSREVAALYIACGIDPHASVMFLQSGVAAHPYLGWILTCCTPLGWLERMTQFKSKSEGRETVGAGLFTYPCLQASDILLYQPDLVPVGEDQKQHIELTRDIAQRFNGLFGECFKLPAPQIRASGARIMGLDDPETKMSKSYSSRPGHGIFMLDDPKVIQKTIMTAKTDSGGELRFDLAGAGVRNLLTLFEVLSGESRAAIEARFVGKGYGGLKKAVAEVVIEKLRPIQEQHRELMRDAGELDRLLAEGARRAAEVADHTLSRVRQLTGL